MGCQQSTTSVPSSACQGKAMTPRITVNGQVISGSSIQVQTTYNSQIKQYQPITVVSTVDCAERSTFVITDSQGHSYDNTPYTIPNGARGTITHTFSCGFEPGLYNVKIEAYASQVGSSTLNVSINVVGPSAPATPATIPTQTLAPRPTGTSTPPSPGTRQLAEDPASSNLWIWIIVIIIVLILLWLLWRQQRY